MSGEGGTPERAGVGDADGNVVPCLGGEDAAYEADAAECFVGVTVGG